MFRCDECGKPSAPREPVAVVAIYKTVYDHGIAHLGVERERHLHQVCAARYEIAVVQKAARQKARIKHGMTSEQWRQSEGIA